MSYNSLTTDANLLLWLKGDGTPDDDSPNALSPAWTGTATYNTSNKKFGYSNSISIAAGSANYITVSDTSLNFSGTQNFTVCCHYHPHTSVPATVIYGAYQNSGAFPGYALGVDILGGEKANAYLDNNAAWKAGTTGAGTLGSFKHIGYTYDGSDIQFYYNGSADGSAIASSDIDAWTGTKHIGSNTSGTNRGNYYLNDLFLFDRALSGTEMAELEAGPEPLNTVAPSLSGTEQVGQTLSCTTGTWNTQGNGTVTYTYQWTRSTDGTGTGEANISGATSSTYTLVAADAGKFIRCLVAASNDGGNDSTEDTNSGFTGAIASLSLTAATGAFTLTGQAATFGISAVASAGSFAETGNPAAFGINLTSDTGSFVLTGNAANLQSNIKMTAATGAFALAGQAAAFGVSMVSAVGSFTLTGNDATLTLTTADTLLAQTGTFTHTGNDASLNLSMACETGSFVETGNDASFSITAVHSAGSFALAGPDVFFGVSLTAETGTLSLVGMDLESAPISASPYFFILFVSE